MQSESVTKVKNAFLSGIWATLVSIGIGFTFKIWLAAWVPKTDLALFHSVVDIISLSMILMTGFRSSMVVTYSQTQNDTDIINIFRFTLILVVLITWGGVIPYIKHSLSIGVEYLQLVGIIFGLGLKLYFTNLVAMYRLYDITNRTTWLDPSLNVLLFLFAYYVAGYSALTALFYGLTISSLITALYMYISRRKVISTLPIKPVRLDPDMFGYVKKSFTATLEAGASILMIYIAVLLTIRYFSVDELGDFQVVVRPVFTYMTMLFVFPIYRFVLPELSVKIRNGEYQEIQLIRRWVFKLSFIVSAVFLHDDAAVWFKHCRWAFPAGIYGCSTSAVSFFYLLYFHDAQRLSTCVYQSEWLFQNQLVYSFVRYRDLSCYVLRDIRIYPQCRRHHCRFVSWLSDDVYLIEFQRKADS